MKMSISHAGCHMLTVRHERLLDVVGDGIFTVFQPVGHGKYDLRSLSHLLYQIVPERRSLEIGFA